MSVLAVLLVAVGVTDLLRSALPVRPRRPVVAAAAGVVLVVATSALAGTLGTAAGRWLAVAAALGLLAWVLTTERTLRTGRAYLLPLAVLLVSGLVPLLWAGAAPEVGGPFARWLAWAELPWAGDPAHALLVAGLVLVQLSTGNLVVRLVLTSTGAMRPGHDRGQEELRGGRLLGPLERLFVLGLGLAGEVTAAGLVIAAKGLIRWPELRSHAGDGGRHDIDKVTEYFLVGSFVSWLVALGALALAS